MIFLNSSFKTTGSTNSTKHRRQNTNLRIRSRHPFSSVFIFHVKLKGDIPTFNPQNIVSCKLCTSISNLHFRFTVTETFHAKAGSTVM